MKCTHCGLPLSPNATYRNCPRCQAPLGAAAEPARHQSAQLFADQPFSSSTPPRAGVAPAFRGTPPPLAPQSGQLWQAASPPPHLSPYRHAYNHGTPGGTRPRPRAAQTGNIGFIIAGLCVCAGALILVFVYFVALELPSTSARHDATAVTAITATTHSSVATPTAVAPTPTATLAPSPTRTRNGNPGAQYIDNPQMASTVNFSTAQPLQTTTTFKGNQRVYVTFDLHPAGRSGAVCLYWYLNTKFIAQYPFAVTPNDMAGYSYAIYAGSGPAHVEIYWASTTACSDKILAQQLQFRITAA